MRIDHRRYASSGRSRRRPPTARARGQALVFALASMVVLVLGVIVLFNTGQALDKKVELVNAADAAAYSVAVRQARAYNAIAYLNRASVANQVVMAQMVSWYSWGNYILSGTDNLRKSAAALAAVAALVGAEPVALALVDAVIVFGRIKTALRQGRDRFVRPGFRLASEAIVKNNELYANATDLIAISGSAESLLLAKDIVRRATDGRAKIGGVGAGVLTTDAASALSYTRAYLIPTIGRSPDADRYADVAMEARDGFSRKRSDKIAVVRKRGGTDLIDYRHWVGTDTLNAKFSIPFKTVNIPLAWGGGAVSESVPFGFKALAKPGFNGGEGWNSPYAIDLGKHKRYDGGIDNGKAGKKVLKDPAVGGETMAWIAGGSNFGLRPYRDTQADKATVPYDNGRSPRDSGVAALDVGPVFTVLVEQPMATVRTSPQIAGMGTGSFALSEQPAGGAISAIASAQVYFSRPRELFPRAIDSRRELGNLFSPYWQARLVETPCADRSAAVVAGTAAPCIP